MKRRVILCLLLLVAGAIVNVAVAWGCAFTINHARAQAEVAARTFDTGFWAAVKWEQTGRLDVASSWLDPSSYPNFEDRGVTPQTFLEKCEGIDGPALQSEQIAPLYMQLGRYNGWPLLALGTNAYQAHGSPLSVRGGIELDPSVTRFHRAARILPLRPLWPGFAINTVFYAFIVWLLFAAPFALRRRRRIKRGLCPKCAYPVGTNQVCTECGAAVKENSVNAASAESVP